MLRSSGQVDDSLEEQNYQLNELRRLFHEYEEDPSQRLRHKLRRWRAQQIRQLLADPDRVDLQTFNRDVWNLESDVRLDGENVAHIILHRYTWTPEKIAELSQAIDSGQLEYHGNSVWGSASRVYAPMIKDDARKIANVREALRILNDNSRTPVEKATEMWAVDGFGPNITTGLVMLYHPDQFALFNTQTLGALQKLGYDVGNLSPRNLERFEAVTRTLKDDLQADDFLELDEFLEQVNRGAIGAFNSEEVVSSGEARSPVRTANSETERTPYSLEKCATETGINAAELRRWLWEIHRKGQAILYGPPGTGKTFVAQRLARHLVADGHGVSEIVQFHPAYSYEDFIEGIRPETSDGVLSYPLVRGRFLQFCDQARRHPNDISVLIIDEINRANLSEVFGELMYLLEYRNEAIKLAAGEHFEVPSNVRILGTMNTADRSIALVDFALRRRFAFCALAPNFGVLRRYHQGSNYPIDRLIGLLENLNSDIGDPNYALGPSFFMTPDLPQHVADIWQMEIYPYIEEYFFDQPDRARRYSWHEVEAGILA